MSPFRSALALSLLLLSQGTPLVRGQQPVGTIEKFALAEDRRLALEELIPATEEFFYYHALHFQNEGQLAEARGMLEAWRTKLGESQPVQQMFARQQLLEYATHPQQTLAYLKQQLALSLDHAPPSRDRAAQLPSQLDNAQLELPLLIEQSLATDPSLSGIRTDALPLLVERQLNVPQLRALLGRLERADLPGLVEKIASELALQDSAGFGWAAVHARLTLEQHQELRRLQPQLLENDNFVRAVTARLAPPAGTSLSDQAELRKYLERLHTWTQQLPPSQNSFKALVLGNLLRLDISQQQYDRQRFLEYLALPRSAAYYQTKKLQDLRVGLVQLDYRMNPQVPLPAMGDDSDLVHRCLQHFLQADDSLDPYAAYINRETLDRVLAQTKILYGQGDEATWYSKLTPAEQKELRERVELRFAPHNPHQFTIDDAVSLEVELKHVDQLLVKIYQVNLRNYYRQHSQPLGTDIDLDGLVPNQQRQLTFSQPAQRRHTEKLEFPEFMGRGTWVVDLLGAGQRSRALVHKGRLLAQQRLGDAGQVFEIIDETGNKIPSAQLELNARQFSPNEQGEIVLPYAEQTVTRQVLLVDGDFAAPLLIAHHSEAYELQAGFLVDRQALVAGTQANVAIRARLSCNGRPVSLQLLEQAQLTIVATDLEGISTTQTVAALDLADGDELVHSFLVPQRLASLSLTLGGRVVNRSRQAQQPVSSSYELECNGIQATAQIGDFFLRETSQGYRMMVLGRNGEPLPRLPIELATTFKQLTQPQRFTLATDEAGAVELGALADVAELTVSAQDIQATVFTLENLHRHWPTVVHLGRGESLVLPLGNETSSAAQFSLVEMRRGMPTAILPINLTVEQGGLRVADLPAGEYVLHDHPAGQRVQITVGDAPRRDGWIVTPESLLQGSRLQSLVIRQAEIKEGKLVVAVDGADAQTRLHIVADAWLPATSAARQLQLPHPPLMQQSVTAQHSQFVDSLRLDEEYSYILDRRQAQKYPGNLLAQPSLLIHPWEVSVTENLSQEAAAGDAMSRLAAPAAPAPQLQAEAEEKGDSDSPAWKSFDFLAKGQVLLANVALENGQATIDIAPLAGCNSWTIVVVHPINSDSRHMVHDSQPLPVRDQRLREAFAAEVHLSQVQKMETLAAGETKQLGDPRTRRLQAYASIADVFELYNTLLGDAEWEKFRFVTRWQQLSAQERQAHYSDMACHELNFFLYHHDREFFDRVVKPLLANKMDKQLVDHWLLGESLAEHEPLWRVQRLNTLERILLAERIESHRQGTGRWLKDFLQAYPLSPSDRQQRFEIALRGSSLSTERSAGLNFGMALAEDMVMNGAMGGMGGMHDPARSGPHSSSNGVEQLRHKRGLAEAAKSSMGRRDKSMENEFFGVDRFALGVQPDGFFQSLDKTREWAEAQYYHLRLDDQSAQLIPPNPFWHEFLDAGAQPFLPRDLDLPTDSLSEALCALAVIDLPLAPAAPTLSVVDGQLSIHSDSVAVIFLESIEPTQTGQATLESDAPESEDSHTEVPAQVSVLVGQEIYLANPSTNAEANRPVTGSALLRGVPYRASVVVTNPTNTIQRVQVLTQLPAGSLPLGGSKLTRSTALELSAYSTSQVAYQFYFPAAGDFAHYGAQVSSAGHHVADTVAATHRVLAKPESVDQTTWSYVADWGTTAEVMQFLQTANLERVDLSRIAFRMADKPFYTQVTQLLSDSGRFEPALWAYAVAHDDRPGIVQLLQQRPDFISQLGAALDSPLALVDPSQQMSYEHLDYRPLVVARAHRLGREIVILNPSLHQHYHALLDIIAHQPQISHEQRMQLCYYLLLQNRITEALHWFAQVDVQQLAGRIQYDYFDAYLDFYRGQYEHAAKIAERYAEYPAPRWAELFADIAQQVSDHQRLLAGMSLEVRDPNDPTRISEEGVLTDRREQQLAAQAEQGPTLDLEVRDGQATIRHRGLETVQVNYYLMDIELLFSRNPFGSQAGDQLPAIQPNLSQQLELSTSQGAQLLELPEAMRNRNVLVEVTAAGISRSSWLTASSLLVSLSEPVGRLQVLSQTDRAPVAGAYVKVYARHSDGAVRFFKDGYTDLNGHFDYASLSTADLDSSQRLSILILDEKLGAVLKEASPPTR